MLVGTQKRVQVGSQVAPAAELAAAMAYRPVMRRRYDTIRCAARRPDTWEGTSGSWLWGCWLARRPPPWRAPRRCCLAALSQEAAAAAAARPMGPGGSLTCRPTWENWGSSCGREASAPSRRLPALPSTTEVCKRKCGTKRVASKRTGTLSRGALPARLCTL